jgi:hypothetical protein
MSVRAKKTRQDKTSEATVLIPAEPAFGFLVRRVSSREIGAAALQVQGRRSFENAGERPRSRRVAGHMVNRRFTKRHQSGSRVLISLLSAFFSAYSTNIKRFA